VSDLLTLKTGARAFSRSAPVMAVSTAVDRAENGALQVVSIARLPFFSRLDPLLLSDGRQTASFSDLLALDTELCRNLSTRLLTDCRRRQN
jgi:hypothetical protein